MGYVLPELEDFLVVEHLRDAGDFGLTLAAAAIDLMDVDQVLRSELVEVVVLVHSTIKLYNTPTHHP
jgi:hypothetical protein